MIQHHNQPGTKQFSLSVSTESEKESLIRIVDHAQECKMTYLQLYAFIKHHCVVNSRDLNSPDLPLDSNQLP